jgi:putative transposase
MKGPKPPAVKLSEVERQALEKLQKAHSTEQQIALRARIVLAAGDGLNNAQIVRQLAISIDTVRQWRKRWLGFQPVPYSDLSVEERLHDLPRPGAPARISADQVCQIMALACEKPEQSGRPITRWTGREIADEIKKRGIIDQISPRHAARLLKIRRPQATFDTFLAHARTRRAT